METVINVLKWLSGNLNVMTLSLLLVVGVFSYYVDSSQMRAKNLFMEARWAKMIGLIYIIGSIGLWISMQIMLRLFGMR